LRGESLPVLLEIVGAEVGHEPPHPHKLRETLQDGTAVLEPLEAYLVRFGASNLESEVMVDNLLDRNAICRYSWRTSFAASVKIWRVAVTCVK
jgi:hypothetical protein